MMGKKACCTKEGLNRGAWTSQEDKLLSDYIMTHGLGRWRTLPANAGLNRCGKSCRLRWLNYLRPDIKRGNITEEEEELIVRLHKLLGNRWSLIAGRLPGRTDNEIKNYWNTYLKKVVMGEVTAPHSSSKYKKVLLDKQIREKKQGSSEFNVIRTRAFRCTRALFTDHDHTSLGNNSSASPLSTPTATSGAGFLPNLRGREGAACSSSMDRSGLGVEEIMQCSPFFYEPKGGFYNAGNGDQYCDTTNAVTTPISGDNKYIRGIYDGVIDEGEDLSSFLLGADSWDSLILPNEI